MMDQSNIGSGATVAELMQGLINALKLTEKNWAQYERYRARSTPERGVFP